MTTPAPARGPSIGPATQRLLIVCPSRVGDLVMATPVLAAARQACPDASIVALVRPGLEQLIEDAAWLDDTLPARVRGLVRNINNRQSS